MSREIQNANLIPITKRCEEDAKKIQIMGGKATKGIIKYSQKTCKRCRLNCDVKEKRSKIKGAKCLIPQVQRAILAVHLEPNKYLEAAQGLAKELIELADTHKEKKAAFDSVISMKNTFAPERKQIDVSVETITYEDFANALIVDSETVKEEE